MDKWISVKDSMPDTEIECLVAAKEHDLIYTHKVFAQWDGSRWVDADGCEIVNVVSWIKAPQFKCNTQILATVSRIEECLDHDTCDQEKCRYFAHPHDLLEVLEYIKKMEGLE